MIRVHLTADDLARARIAHAPEPFAETVDSIRTLQRRDQQAAFEPWRSLVRSRFSFGTMGPLLDLVPPGSRPGERPDLLTTLRGTRSLDEALALLSDGQEDTAVDRTALDRLGAAFRAYHRIAIAPYWPRISAVQHAEIAIRRRVMAEQGVEALLGTLHRSVRWCAPVLEIAHPDCVDIRLEGQGLLLAPSFFLWPTVQVHVPRAPKCAPLQVKFPVSLDPLSFRTTVWGEKEAAGAALPSLLGRTRAAALQAIETGSLSTTELGRRLGVTPAAASQHAGVLRAAGLITTRRQGGCVHHNVTSLGTALVRGSRLLGGAPPVRGPSAVTRAG
ncbi:ArsR/SmtB family transcription factor [Streptomyces sp. NPDC002073]|uniref:ArsR/SmtB family transcription factor n=1 Tax=Streptomyces sp. NBC_00239 TaxID=2903640 RepID=UPI002E2D2F48|nr:winged helix-turn-helix domain-containing protein [Streptomyces sp. NBC_00239]